MQSFAHFLSASSVDSRYDTPHYRTQLSLGKLSRCFPSAYPFQEKGISQLLLITIHSSQKAIGIAHVLNEKTMKQKILSVSPSQIFSLWSRSHFLLGLHLKL